MTSPTRSPGTRPHRPPLPDSPLTDTPPILPHSPRLAKLPFWQRPFAQDVLPFVTSLVLHIGLMAAALLAVKAIVGNLGPTTQSSSTGLIVDEGPPLGALDVPPTQDWKLPTQKDIKNENDGYTKELGLGRHAFKSAGNQDPLRQSLIALGDPDPIGPNSLVGVGGKDLLPGSKGGLKLARQGNEDRLSFGVDTGTTKPVFSPVDDRSVVYVCDASGSMVGKFDALRDQLRYAVGRLTPIQNYSVIFFREKGCQVLDRAGLVLANTDGRRRVAAFVDEITPRGSTDPIPALEMAYRLRPQVIHLLTDGEFPDTEAVLKLIRQNRDKNVRINTIAFVTHGDHYEQVLKTIASETGGRFRYVSDEDLGQ